MSTFDSQDESLKIRAPLADQNIENSSANSDARDAEALATDMVLVERCIRGEVEAWEALYQKCHDPLCTTIRIYLGRLGADPHLVDEMAARVWYTLVDHDGKRLTKYNARRGSILTFFRLIAREEISHYYRSERRRLKNELASLINKNRREAADRSESLPTLLAEFLSSLTPREREFCSEYLLVSSDENRLVLESSFSPANIWQLTHRIYKKFLSYIGRTP